MTNNNPKLDVTKSDVKKPRNPRDRRNKKRPRRERRPEDRHAHVTLGELLKPEQRAALEELREELKNGD